MPEQREFTAKSHTFYLGNYKFTKTDSPHGFFVWTGPSHNFTVQRNFTERTKPRITPAVPYTAHWLIQAIEQKQIKK